MSRRRIGFWYRLAAVICKPPLLVLFKRDWQGMEHIPADGGFITAVNHNSYLDPLSYAHYQYNTGRVPRFLAKAGLFKSGFVGLMMRGTGQIPVYRETTDAATAFRAAVSAIEKGECVAFYPEGTLTRDPELWPMQGKTGAARVALLTKAPVIPVAQWGANDAMPPYAKEKKLRLLPRKTLRVQAGPPVDLSAFYDQEPTAEVLRAATEVIMAAITEQLAVVRGEPAPAEPYDWRKAIARERRAAREAAKAVQGAAADRAPAERAAAPEPAVGPQQARSTQQAQEDESK
ncbi:1-acyl-sn-glycerol-3-phosphate acyltransferases [Streptomyces sp. 2224.1]|uniref:lysophospholipid acyltransferase family protein n=1 Tax=unclassified Streptomyces TaxID=2593676 RepID=UPI00088027FA|nr:MULTISPECIES: lysophospholipid acyltransferase family protein [unclassified Streptomyces]PBC85284.1 1-acyl-sn-glycerol-3-phosphate acyltransferase [Streptomyces sp. 2321.6]SDR18428.1 1-acyl-sn-glycerol-3-phosphate acyltransferases [Streptomyces sp. KS_16]SEB50708.1 1-acyl-sn-glycerol-3-phosphate acyltransferases [Streptomyces sp. 2224.1]SED62583.1 1-acyl-sn-glycerol-3-phosphate acyltransferases [Streptomyces sp. 2133.1]SEE20963.1 1-acyl-sn-glycerol-3-phosphate acyltransferases [Streptomyces